MARRGTLYRCHFFGWGIEEIQTEGVTSRWMKNLEHIGDRDVFTGECIEMLVEINNDEYRLDENTQVRFDILEEDVMFDDRVVSLVIRGAPEPSEPFPTVRKEIHFHHLTSEQNMLGIIEEFKDFHPADYRDYILIIERTGAPPTYYVLAWWVTTKAEESVSRRAELYFIVNVADLFEDRNEEVLHVIEEPVEPEEVGPRIWLRIQGRVIDRYPFDPNQPEPLSTVEIEGGGRTARSVDDGTFTLNSFFTIREQQILEVRLHGAETQSFHVNIIGNLEEQLMVTITEIEENNEYAQTIRTGHIQLNQVIELQMQDIELVLELKRLFFVDKRLEQPHLEDIRYRAKLEQMSANELQFYLDNATDDRIIQYLQRVIEFVNQQEALSNTPIGVRENITFIMGDDPFYRAASRYFSQNPAGSRIDGLRNLLDVRNYLENNPPSNGLGWGEINIITHATEEGGMGVSLVPHGGRANPKTVIDAINGYSITNIVNFINQLVQDRTIFQYIREQLSEETQDLLNEYKEGNIDASNVEDVLRVDLNRLIKDEDLYNSQYFELRRLSREAQRLIRSDPIGNDLHRLNRLLLSHVFGSDFSVLDRFFPLSNNLMDVRTTIRIRGCAIGRSDDMLHRLSIAFGGDELQRPKIRAPKHLQSYEFHTLGRRVVSVEEYLREYWYIGYPHGERPSEDDIIIQFEEKYPDVDINWRRYLRSAVTRNRSYTLGYSYQYYRIPHNARELRQLVRSAIEGANDAMEIQETNRVMQEDGSVEIEVSYHIEDNQYTDIITAGPNPPVNNAEREELLRQVYGGELIDQYNWSYRPNNRSLGNRLYQYTLNAEGRRTILRIERDLTIQLTSPFFIDSEFRSDLNARNISQELRQVFEENRIRLSQQNIELNIIERDERWVIIDHETIQSYLLNFESGQLNVYAEEEIVPEQPDRAHLPITNLNHFGEEVAAYERQRPWGENVPIESE